MPGIDAPTPGNSLLCQIETAHEGGRMRRPGIFYLPLRLLQILRAGGVKHALQTTVFPRIAALRDRVRGNQHEGRPSAVADEALHLEPGDIVEVKALDEILATLDEKGRFRGLTFTPEMRQHCGKRFRVFKRLELMFDEYHNSQRRVKNTVLLEGVVCTGAGLGCDRSCFLYWREAWLRRCKN
jgi:hypothetical protein